MPSRVPLKRRPVWCQARISSAQLRVVSTIWRYSGNCPVSYRSANRSRVPRVPSWSLAYRGRTALGERVDRPWAYKATMVGVEAFQAPQVRIDGIGRSTGLRLGALLLSSCLRFPN